MMGWTKDTQSRLRLGKRYLKRDYKAKVLHIHSITFSNTLTVLKAEYTFVEALHGSTVADHCKLFALSDPKKLAFQAQCGHHHDDTCDRNDQLMSSLSEIESAMIAQTYNLLPELGVAIKRLDFSDPQFGKGASDRKAVLIKSHMHIHLNSGNDIEKLAQMVEAILSSGGVASVSVTRYESITSPPMVTCKIDGLSKLSNTELTIEGIRVWRAYGVGPGKLISAPKAEIPSPDTLPSMVV
ncbi:unnamed protein product [Pocillopora meandrina]|uniref:Uncharacterized protein n=1 Tax=Pocillopora meandrina TaxID=46732 RepID=A0AAU9XE43_9CNID|nr:unnamed protein product [Pocillopora meandrina]